MAKARGKQETDRLIFKKYIYIYIVYIVLKNNNKAKLSSASRMRTAIALFFARAQTQLLSLSHALRLCLFTYNRRFLIGALWEMRYNVLSRIFVLFAH